MAGGSRFRRGLWALLMGVMMSCASVGAAAGPVPTQDRPESPGPSPAGLPSPFPGGLSQAGAAELCGRLPLYFTENRGQLDGSIKYYEQGRGRAVYFTPAGLEFAFLQDADPGTGPGRRPRQGKSLREKRFTGKTLKNLPLRQLSLTPVGMSPEVRITGVDRQAGEVNYLTGQDPQKHHTRLPTYGAVVYEGAYPGIDLKFYGAGRQLEYDVIVRPGADPGRVSFRYQGIRGLTISGAGDLNVLLPEGGSLVQKKPVIYQEIAGVRVPREGAFKLHPGRDACRYSFTVASYDKKFPLVIDPIVLYSTYLGGSGYDVGNAIAVDSNGNAYITGCTFSRNFPTQGAYDPGLSGNLDVLVTKLDLATNTLVYSTYLGGEGAEEGYGIAVDAQGNAYVTGYTDSSFFPTASPWQSSRKGSADAFLTKLNPAGNALIYSTYLGDDDDDAAYGVALGPDGSAYITGETSTPYSLYNVVTARLNAGGALIYRVMLTGSSDNWGNGIAVDMDGNAYVTGETRSGNFPTTAGAFQRIFAGDSDAFVSKLNAAGAVVYSTFLGGRGEDKGWGIAMDSSGCVYVTGTTRSDDFPLAGPWQSTKNGKSDAFVAKLDPAGTTLHYASYLGGDYEDEGYGIAVDSLGAAHITGWTAVLSTPPPPPAAAASAPVSESLFFTGNTLVARVNPSGANPDYIMSLGGSEDDWGNGIAIGPDGHAYVTGETWSRNFPVNNPFQGILAGDADAFVAKISPIPPIVETIITPLLLDE